MLILIIPKHTLVDWLAILSCLQFLPRCVSSLRFSFIGGQTLHFGVVLVYTARSLEQIKVFGRVKHAGGMRSTGLRLPHVVLLKVINHERTLLATLYTHSHDLLNLILN